MFLFESITFGLSLQQRQRYNIGTSNAAVFSHVFMVVAAAILLHHKTHSTSLEFGGVNEARMPPDGKCSARGVCVM